MNFIISDIAGDSSAQSKLLCKEIESQAESNQLNIKIRTRSDSGKELSDQVYKHHALQVV